ncbi:MAG: hypothetical protein AAF703_09290 [Cyanobacteria bacterium P01_D01_bin.105]
MPFSPSNQKIDLALAIAQLRSHKIHSLFQSIGWQPSAREALTIQQLRCTPIACCQGVTAWQVSLPEHIQLTPTLRRRLYEEISALALQATSEQIKSQQIKTTEEQTIQAPLVVFVDGQKTRSLWCSSPQDSALYVAGQPAALWRFRLQRLSQCPRRFLSVLEVPVAVAEAEYQTLKSLLDTLRDSISGISNPADKGSYALLTLQRLMIIQVMQAKGWLEQDPWYLQNRFGKITQGQGRQTTSTGVFFTDCLQPLYRSLALPRIERPLRLIEQAGSVPFIEGVFDTHPLEDQYGAIAMADQPFENILGWLSEQSHSGTLNPFASGRLSYWLSRYWQAQSPQTTPSKEDIKQIPALPRALRQHSLDAFLKNKIIGDSRLEPQQLEPQQLEPQQFESATVNTLLFNANAKCCRHLIQEVLPKLRILDPACGSGELLADMNKRLVELFAILTGYRQQTQDAQLNIWPSAIKPNASETAASEKAFREEAFREEAFPETAVFEKTLEEAPPNLLSSIQKQVLKNNLYGVDINSAAVETAKFQLLLAALVTMHTPDELTPLPDLSFNLLAGNSLIGFINVDEKRFDQVNKAGEGEILQGNLLQPLAAEGYKTILSEKNLALEHYKSRNQVLAAASSIPNYARASLLREEISQLDSNAQSKLNALLLNYMGQQLGIQYKAMQLADKPQRRLLTAEDIDILSPFHWGYHFNTILQRGGFDIIACLPTQGAFKPTPEEFCHYFPDLAIAKKLDAKSLKTSKQALSQADPAVTQAWMFYQDTYTYIADYFYRCEQYAHQNPTAQGKPVRQQLMRERLLIERCLSLLAPNGRWAIALGYALSETPKAQPLWQHLTERSDCVEQPLQSSLKPASASRCNILSGRIKQPD